MLALLLHAASGHTYTHKTGFIGKGGDVVPPRPSTLADAEEFCSSQTKCVAITFAAEDMVPNGTIPKVYFKMHGDFFADSAWNTYLRDYVPPPPMLINPCTNASSGQAGLPWCDHTLPVSARVADMISRMSVTEKISQLGTESPGVPSLHLVKYDWWSEASHGVASGNHGAHDVSTTNFAFPITTAMAFNRSLWRATGAAIGIEARAAMNAGHAYSTFWAPVINLAREPRWGRNVETPGEDPYLSGEYAVNFVRGMQVQASRAPRRGAHERLRSSMFLSLSHLHSLIFVRRCCRSLRTTPLTSSPRRAASITSPTRWKLRRSTARAIRAIRLMHTSRHRICSTRTCRPSRRASSKATSPA